MLNHLIKKILPSQPQKIAKSFKRLGWVAFWLQLVMTTLPILLMIYVLFFCSSASLQRSGVGIGEYLGLFGLAVLLFTIVWAYRYTRLGDRMADPKRRPPKESVIQSLWIGLLASCLGILFAMLLMFIEVGRLLFVFLDAPQGGVQVVQTETQDPSTWASAIDMVGLLADLSVLAAELMFLAFTLWLLFRMTLSGAAYDQSVDSPAA